MSIAFPVQPMATNRVQRLLQLIMLLQRGEPLGVEELMERLGVSRRTLFRDLNMLEDAGVPYYHQAGEGYRISERFYLPPINLTVPETLGLMLLGKSASQQGGPMIAQALSAIYKLIATVPEPLRSACGDMMAAVSVSPDPGVNADAENAHYGTLQRCIEEGRACKIVYQSPVEQEVLVCDFEPYALHYANRAWYVMGATDQHEDVRTFKLVRLAEVEMLDRPFFKPQSFKATDKLGNAWRLIPEGQVYEVELLFTAKVAVNVSEVRWHATQKQTLLSDGRCRMHFTVDGIGEIAWWVCGYADQVEVVKPLELRQRVEAMHRNAASIYLQNDDQ